VSTKINRKRKTEPKKAGGMTKMFRVRMTADDQKLIDKIAYMQGLPDTSSVIRYAVRRTAEALGIQHTEHRSVGAGVAPAA